MLGRIQSKFIFVASLAVVALLALVTTNIWSSNSARIHSSELLKISTITQRHMFGDMMHDAIRSDVIGGLLALEQNDPATIQSSSADLEEHINNFAENIAANRAEQLPGDMERLFRQAEAALNDYADASRGVLAAALAASDTTAAFEEFNAKFEVMEVENESISDAIQAWAESETATAASATTLNTIVTSVIALIAGLLVLATPFYAWKALFIPLRKTTATMEAMASGDYSTRIDGTNRSDEIGDIARTLLVFRENGQERRKAEQQRLEDAERADQEKRRVFQLLATEFQNRVDGIIKQVMQSTTGLKDSSKRMTDDIGRASERAGNVSHATRQATSNVQTVASAAEEMSSSIHEIAGQISHSSEAIVQVVSEMNHASETSRLLEDATHRVGEIVEFIQNITGQINLLALNATIESARAGEAGKGFAVVANEVKTLAGQTSKATEDITQSIDNIRNVSGQVSATIESIKTAIDSVQEISHTISASIQQQSSATNEIASNMGRVSTENETVSRDISAVSEASSQVQASAAENMSEVVRLAEYAQALDGEIRKFLDDIRAA